MKISQSLRNFFEVEIRNENFGGVSPSTLNSASDSLFQAPDDVIADWAKTEDVAALKLEFNRVMLNLGGETKLEDILNWTHK